MSRIACFLIVDFPAWARQRFGSAWPQLGVYGEGQQVVAASPALREAGLRPGESLARAKALYPEASFYPRDPALEAAVWEEVLERLHGISPHLLGWKPGWAWLAPEDREGLRALTRTLGAQTGIAARRLWAGLAALHAGESATLDLSEPAARQLHAQASCRCLSAFDVDEELLERLELFGLSTLGRLAGLTRKQLAAQFGTEGEALFQLLHPPQPEPPLPLFQPLPVVGVSCDFESPALEPAEVEPALLSLVQRAVEDLGDLHAQRVALRLEGRRGRRAGIARRVLRAPSARPSVFWNAARTLLYSLLSGETALERMSLELGGLSAPKLRQGKFSFTRPAVYEAVRGMQQRFPGSLRRARLAHPHALLPEERVAWEPYPMAAPDAWR